MGALASGKSATISAPITVVNGLTKLGTGALILSGTLTFSGGNLNASAGTLTLSAANSITTNVNLSSGTLNLNNANAIGSAALVITGGTLDNTSTAAITLSNTTQQQWNGDFSYGGTQNLTIGSGATSGSVALGGNRIITVNGTPPASPTGTNDNLNINCPISGTGYSLTKQGPGALAIGEAVTYTGDTYILGGILDISDGTGGNLALATSPIIHIENGAELAIRGHSNVLAVNNTLDIPTGTSGIIYGRDSPSVDPAGFTSGTGTLTLLAATGSTFTLGNNTTASTGGQWNNFGGPLLLRSTGTTTTYFRFLYNSATPVFQNLDIGPYCYFSNRNTETTVSINALSGGDSTSFLVSGTGTPTYQIGNAGTDTVYSGNIAALSSGNVVSTSLNITKVGVGKLTLSGSAILYTGTTTINGGTLQIGNGGTTGNLGTGAVTNNSALAFNRSNSLTVANAISGSGYISVNTGIVYFNNNTAYVANPVEVKSGATMGGQGRITQLVTVDSGGIIENGQAGTGALTVGSLNFLGTSEHTADINYTTSSGLVSTLTVLSSGTNVVTHGVNSVYINISGTPVNNGTYDLINYGGTAGGTITDFNAFKLGTTPSSGIRAKTYTLVNNANEIDLKVVGTDNNTTWTGAGDAIWDNSTARVTKNWAFNVGGAQTDFVIGDNVTFGDGGPRNRHHYRRRQRLACQRDLHQHGRPRLDLHRSKWHCKRGRATQSQRRRQSDHPNQQ